jgi:hypothetical protein
MMTAVSSSESPVTICQTTRRNIPEDGNLNFMGPDTMMKTAYSKKPTFSSLFHVISLK